MSLSSLQPTHTAILLLPKPPVVLVLLYRQTSFNQKSRQVLLRPVPHQKRCHVSWYICMLPVLDQSGLVLKMWLELPDQRSCLH